MGKTFSTGLLTNGIWQDASNNIGIGGSPSGSYKLEVTGTSRVSGTATFSSIIYGSNGNLDPTAGTNAGTTLALNGNSAANNYSIGLAAIRNSAYDMFFQTGATNGGGYRWYIGTSEKMTMSSTGNVGIGTSSPASYFTTTLTIDGSSSQGIMFRASGTDKGFLFQDGSFIQLGSNTGGVIFKSNDTERMRITSGGGVALTGNGNLDINPPAGNANISMRSGNTFEGYIAALTGGGIIFGTGASATTRMTISATGNIGAPSGTNIYNASDVRLKQNVITIEDGLNKIIGLNPVKFNWIDGFESSEDGKNMLGFIAQEVQSIIPEAVENFGNNSIEIGETIIDNPLRVNEKFIIPVLVKAIQELSAQNQDLKSRLDKAGL
jgi:hypothetical protein